MQVVSPIPVMFSYGLPAQGAAELADVQNDWVAELVRGRPDRFAGLGTVPLQTPDRAAEVVATIRGDLGLAGVEIGTNVAGAPLDAPELEVFWSACEQTDALVFAHPWQVLGAERLRAHGLDYAVGNPAETAAAAATLILGGVLDRHPAVRIVLAHGGGAFLPLLPRLDQVASRTTGRLAGCTSLGIRPPVPLRRPRLRRGRAATAGRPGRGGPCRCRDRLPVPDCGTAGGCGRGRRRTVASGPGDGASRHGAAPARRSHEAAGAQIFERVSVDGQNTWSSASRAGVKPCSTA